MSEELIQTAGLSVTVKDADFISGPIGDTTNLPANWDAFQASLWETLTFQPNINVRTRSNDAVGLSLALQCADVKARDIAKSDMVLWRREERRWTEVEPKDHWLARKLARKPNDVHSWTEFWRMVVIHLEIAQNAYILKVIDRKGNVLELLPLPSAMCRPRISDTGRIFYEIASSTEFDRARMGDYHIVVPANRMIHLRGRMYDGLMGLSNVTLGNPLFGLLGAISQFQTQLFGNDGRQPIVFESDATFGTGEVADAAFKRLKDQLTTRVRKMNSGGDPILLEAGYKAKIIAQNARDAMTADAFNATVMRICGLMQTPPHKIFAYESVKYENMSAADNQYANDSLIPIAKNIEEKFRNELLDEETEWDTLWPEFDRMPMVAGDPKTKGDILDKAFKNGGLFLDEYRERLPLDLNPLPNDAGQVRCVPVNMALIDVDGNIIAQGATGQIGNDGEGGEEERSLRLVADNT